MKRNQIAQLIEISFKNYRICDESILVIIANDGTPVSEETTEKILIPSDNPGRPDT